MQWEGFPNLTAKYSAAFAAARRQGLPPLPPEQDYCNCGHEIIDNRVIRNRANGKYLILGSCCIELFRKSEKVDLKRKCADCGCVNRRRKSDLCTRCEEAWQELCGYPYAGQFRCDYAAMLDSGARCPTEGLVQKCVECGCDMRRRVSDLCGPCEGALLTRYGVPDGGRYKRDFAALEKCAGCGHDYLRRKESDLCKRCENVLISRHGVPVGGRHKCDYDAMLEKCVDCGQDYRRRSDSDLCAHCEEALRSRCGALSKGRYKHDYVAALSSVCLVGDHRDPGKLHAFLSGLPAQLPQPPHSAVYLVCEPGDYQGVFDKAVAICHAARSWDKVFAKSLCFVLPYEKETYGAWCAEAAAVLAKVPDELLALGRGYAFILRGCGIKKRKQDEKMRLAAEAAAEEKRRALEAEAEEKRRRVLADEADCRERAALLRFAESLREFEKHWNST
jgi:hypothetical protein